MTGRDLLAQLMRDNPGLPKDALLKKLRDAVSRDKRLAAEIALETFSTLEARNFQGEGVTDRLLHAYLALAPRSSGAA